MLLRGVHGDGVRGVRRRARRRRDRSRSAWAGRGTRPTSPTARSRSSRRSRWTTSATSATRSSRSRREKSGIIKDGATAVLAGQDEDVEGVRARGRGRARAPASCARAPTSRSSSARSRSAASCSPCAARRHLHGGLPAAARRAPGAQRAARARAVEALLTGGARARGGSSRSAFADVDSPGPARGRADEPDDPRRRRAQPRGGRGARVGARGGVRVHAARRRRRRDGGQGPRGHPLACSSRCSPRSSSPVPRPPRALDAADLAEVAVEVFGEDRVHVAERLDDAIELAVEPRGERGEHGAGVLVTGSSCSWRRRGCCSAALTRRPPGAPRRAPARMCTPAHVLTLTPRMRAQVGSVGRRVATERAGPAEGARRKGGPR